MNDTNRTTTATLERGQFSVTLSDEALGYLSATPKHGASRIFAYHALLASCAIEQKTINLPFGGTTELLPNQSLISVTDLASKMDWSRQTARIFLDRLEEFGLIAKQQLDRCSVITMKLAKPTSDTQDSITDGDTIHFPAFIKELVAEWSIGKYTDSELAEAIEMYIAETAGSGNGQVAVSLRRQILMGSIVDVVETVTAQPVSVNPTSISMISMVTDKFIERSQLPDGWRLWMGFMKESKRVAETSSSFANEDGNLADETLCRVTIHLMESIGNLPVPEVKQPTIIDNRQGVLPFDYPSEIDSDGSTVLDTDGTAETNSATVDGQ